MTVMSAALAGSRLETAWRRHTHCPRPGSDGVLFIGEASPPPNCKGGWKGHLAGSRIPGRRGGWISVASATDILQSSEE